MTTKLKPTVKSECIRVVIRCRPMVPREIEDHRQTIVEINAKEGEVIIKKLNISEPPKVFTFDSVYDYRNTQEQIYVESGFPIIENVLEGYNGTIFAYGQTGTGKTHTMEGFDTKDNMGIMPRSFETIFNSIECDNLKKQYLIRASYLEIYMEEIRDLLSKNPKQKLELKEKPESGVYVKDLISSVVNSEKGIRDVMLIGRKNRATAETKMNTRSSRSHSIFTITIETSEIGVDGKNHIRVGKLNMVDLAGSERQSKTGSTGERLEEAIKINLSLSTLCHVISTLVDPKSQHVPYRNSKLTRLLQDSLGGNTKTVMVANIGPADYNFDESLSTLRYASRAKHITNKPQINEDPKDAMLREFQEEITRLKQQLEEQSGIEFKKGEGGIYKKVQYVNLEDQMKELEGQLEEEKQEIQKKMEKERRKIEEQIGLEEQQKKDIIDNIHKKAQEEKKAKENQKKLMKRLKDYEAKLLIGKEAMEQAKVQELQIAKATGELDQRRIKELRIKQELEKKKQAHESVVTRFSSQKEELEAHTKKLKDLWTRYQSAQGEIRDLQDEFYKDRENMMDTIDDLTMQLKLKNLIIDNFIPAEESGKIEKRAIWSSENDTFLLPPAKISFRLGNKQSALGLKRPTSEYTRIARGLGDANPRYKYENIINMDLDKPERMSEDYARAPSTKIQNAISNVLSDVVDDDMAYMAIDAQPGLHTETEEAKNEGQGKKKQRPRTAAKRPASAKKKKEPMVGDIMALVDNLGSNPKKEPKSKYPKAKGLVSSKVIME